MLSARAVRTIAEVVCTYYHFSCFELIGEATDQTEHVRVTVDFCLVSHSSYQQFPSSAVVLPHSSTLVGRCRVFIIFISEKCAISSCGARAPLFPPCPFTSSSFPLFTFSFLSLALPIFFFCPSLTFLPE